MQILLQGFQVTRGSEDHEELHEQLEREDSES